MRSPPPPLVWPSLAVAVRSGCRCAADPRTVGAWRRGARAGADRARASRRRAAVRRGRAPFSAPQRRNDRAAAAAAAPLLHAIARPGSTRRSPSLLDRAAELFDDGDYTGALACAEEAARQAPRSVEAHHNRAIALMRLDRLDEARDALALALALAPDDPETLEAAADLNINQLPPSVDRSALGLEYARRGSRHVAAPRSRAGRAAGAARGAGADRSRARRRGAAPDRRARWRRRRSFAAASLRARRRAVRAVPLRRGARARSRRCWRRRPTTRTRSTTSASSRSATGDDAAAARHLAAATRRRRQVVPAAAGDDAGGFRGARAARGGRAAGRRPPRSRRHQGRGGATCPTSTDLTAEKPPLSPTILGLFRGPAARLQRPRQSRRRPAAPGKGRAQPAPGGGAGTETVARPSRPPRAGRSAVRRGRADDRPLPAQPAAHRARRRRAGPGDHADPAARGRPPARRGRRLPARSRPGVTLPPR